MLPRQLIVMSFVAQHSFVVVDDDAAFVAVVVADDILAVAVALQS